MPHFGNELEEDESDNRVYLFVALKYELSGSERVV